MKLKNLAFLRRLQDEGKSVPVLDQMPGLLPGTEWLWQAFNDLSQRRHINSAGPGAISVSEIKAYAEYQSVDDAWDRELLLHMVGALDRVYLTDAHEQMRKRNKKGAKRQGR